MEFSQGNLDSLDHSNPTPVSEDLNATVSRTNPANEMNIVTPRSERPSAGPTTIYGRKVRFDEEAWLSGIDSSVDNDQTAVVVLDSQSIGTLVPRRRNIEPTIEVDASNDSNSNIPSARSKLTSYDTSNSLEFSQIPPELQGGNDPRLGSEVPDSETHEYLDHGVLTAQESEDLQCFTSGRAEVSPPITHASSPQDCRLQQSNDVIQSPDAVPSVDPLGAAVFRFFSEDSGYTSFNTASCGLTFQDLNKVVAAYYSTDLEGAARASGHGARVPLAVLVSLALNDRARATDQDYQFYHCWSEALNGSVHAHRVVIVVFKAWTKSEKEDWDKLPPRYRTTMTNLVVHPAKLSPNTQVMTMLVADATHRSSEQRVQCEFYVQQDTFDELKNLSQDHICIFTKYQNRLPLLMSIKRLYEESRSDRPNAKIAPSIKLETFTNANRDKVENIVSWYMSTSQHKSKEKPWWSENCFKDRDNWADQILEYFTAEFMRNHEKLLARPYKEVYTQYAKSNDHAILVKGRERLQVAGKSKKAK